MVAAPGTLQGGSMTELDVLIAYFCGMVTVGTWWVMVAHWGKPDYDRGFRDGYRKRQLEELDE